MKPTTALLAAIHSSSCPAQTVISVDAKANCHAINPNIYGSAYPSTAQLLDLNYTIGRYGGNNSSRYNWLINADNRANDWYYSSYGDASDVAGERGDSFFSGIKAGGAQAMITIPLLPYVAKLGPNRSSLWSFSKAKYGNQQSFDPWNGDAGNGVNTSNQIILGNNPLDANVPSDVVFQNAWIQHLIGKWGTSGQGGLKYYILDNEPSIWHATHRDVHPNGETYDELYNDYINFGRAIRMADWNAKIVGPEEWGWSGYFYSGMDLKYGSDTGDWGNLPDRKAHAYMDHVPWLLSKLRDYHLNTGIRLLDVFSLHYYPQQGEFSDDDSDGMRTTRNRSTRSLWDPNYVDTSWIGSVVQLIPRMKSWVNQYYPSLETGITEYNWGDEGKLNGATTQADILGIFGREGLDIASRWTTPTTNSPTYLSMKIYRNYDGSKSPFGDMSVACAVPNPDNLSAFASKRSSDGAMTVMVINKIGSANIRVDLANFTPSSAAEVWQISSDAQTSINHLSNATVSNGSISATVPAQSITLYVIPKSTVVAGPQYDFETDAQGWTSNGGIVSSLNTSTAQHANGAKALAVNLSGAGFGTAFVRNPTVPSGKTITFKVWIPSGSSLVGIQPFAMESAKGDWTFIGGWHPVAQLTTNAWNTITVTLPPKSPPLYQLGVQFVSTSAWSGTCYVDAVSW